VLQGGQFGIHILAIGTLEIDESYDVDSRVGWPTCRVVPLERDLDLGYLDGWNDKTKVRVCKQLLFKFAFLFFSLLVQEKLFYLGLSLRRFCFLVLKGIMMSVEIVFDFLVGNGRDACMYFCAQVFFDGQVFLFGKVRQNLDVSVMFEKLFLQVVDYFRLLVPYQVILERQVFDANDLAVHGT